MAGALGAAVLVFGSNSPGALGITQYRHAGAAVLARLREIVVSFAAANGESHPTHLLAVETSSTRAWPAISAGARVNPPSLPVYLVVANGQFVGRDTQAPFPAAAPYGTTLYLVVKRNGVFVVGWGLNRLDPDLRKLGKVRRL
jgi:hypothetical protein